MARTVEEWIGKTDDERAPPRVMQGAPALRILPLSSHETGRGIRLSATRLAEVKLEALRLIGQGFAQYQIAEAMGCSTSRISRWCRDVVMETRAPRRLVGHRDRALSHLMWDRIGVAAPEECWLWKGSIRANGYGSLNYKGKNHTAHRLVYSILVDEIGRDQVIDHVCCNPSCVNPSHLQAVSQTENLMLARRRQS